MAKSDLKFRVYKYSFIDIDKALFIIAKILWNICCTVLAKTSSILWTIDHDIDGSIFDNR